jgi:hypothetical protein
MIIRSYCHMAILPSVPVPRGATPAYPQPWRREGEGTSVCFPKRGRERLSGSRVVDFPEQAGHSRRDGDWNSAANPVQGETGARNARHCKNCINLHLRAIIAVIARDGISLGTFLPHRWQTRMSAGQVGVSWPMVELTTPTQTRSSFSADYRKRSPRDDHRRSSTPPHPAKSELY